MRGSSQTMNDTLKMLEKVTSWTVSPQAVITRYVHTAAFVQCD
jgi:hypothetical protein